MGLESGRVMLSKPVSRIRRCHVSMHNKGRPRAIRALISAVSTKNTKGPSEKPQWRRLSYEGGKGVCARVSPVPRQAPASIAAERAAGSSSKSPGVAGDVDNDLVVVPRPDTKGPIARVIAGHSVDRPKRRLEISAF